MAYLFFDCDFDEFNRFPIETTELEANSIKRFDRPIHKEVPELQQAEILSVMIPSKITREVLEQMPNLKLICTRSTGYDHIDLEECKKRKITVSNVPFYGENTVAEHTFALILSLSRNLHRAYLRQVSGQFGIKGLKGFDLRGRTLGIVGVGHIGAHLAKMAKGFGMNVLATDVKPNGLLAEVLNFQYVEMDELLQRSDIVCPMVPLSTKTHHLLSEREFSMMKKGSLLINTSRGEVVDTKALFYSLKSGHLGGAGLDVIEGEGDINEDIQRLREKDHQAMEQVILDRQILNMENVVFTPHIAFYSQEALERIHETTIENIQGFLNGEARNIVQG